MKKKVIIIQSHWVQPTWYWVNEERIAICVNCAFSVTFFTDSTHTHNIACIHRSVWLAHEPKRKLSTEQRRINTVRVQTSRSAAQQKLFPGLSSILLCRHFSVLSLTEVWIWNLVSKQFSSCRSWPPFAVRLKLLSSLSSLLISPSLLQFRQHSLISFFRLFSLCVFGCLSSFLSLLHASRGEYVAFS